MKMTEFFLAKLEREEPGTRKAIERVPEGRNDWVPHEKSMQLGYLAALVASMPAWIAMTIEEDGIDMAKLAQSKYQTKAVDTHDELMRLFEDSMNAGRRALASTTDEHLMRPWNVAVNGQLLSAHPRNIILSDMVFSHLAHHRGQLTVYLRLMGVPVPSIYGPTADERGF